MDDGQPLADLIVLTPEQVRLTASPLRSQLLSMLRSGDDLSRSELARRLNVPASRLYHHLKVLVAGGLIQVVGHRRVRGQNEAVYRRVAKQYLIKPSSDDPDSLAAVEVKGAAVLRAAIREHQRAVRRASSNPEVLEHLKLLRSDVCLSKAAAREFFGAVEEAYKQARATHDPTGEVCLSLTFVASPHVSRTV